MSFAPVAVGDLIAGKYLVERIIGEGGMGVVIAARHVELDQIVAIKFLLAEIAKLDMAPERFRREAWAAARIRGEHVCRVLDVGTLPSGVPYMVMEFLDGCDLATELSMRKTIPVEEAVGYVLQACEGLAEAHSAGVIHRDLKPANLFLANRSDDTRSVKVLDFGVSKVLTESGGAALSLTSTKTLVGSPLYMSPEQLDSAKGVDARTDIWALGVVLYELITGRTPFNGDSIAQLVSGVLHADPPPFANVGVEPMADLEEVLKRAVSKRREDRFANVAEFAHELVPFGPPHAEQSALRATRLLAREGSSSLPVSLPSGERVLTPRSSLERARTPSRPVTPPESHTPTLRGTGRDSTPVGWEQEHARTASRRKRVGVAVLGSIATAAAVFIAIQWNASQPPPGAGADESPAAARSGEPDSPAAQPPAVKEPERTAQGSIAATVDPTLLGGIVDAGVTPEPPPVDPPPPVPAPGLRRESAAAERDARRADHPGTAPALRGGASRRKEQPTAPAAPAQEPATAPAVPGGGITDFGGRR